MTVAGQQGDEYISYDTEEWIHDGTAWRPRPHADDLIYHSTGIVPDHTTTSQVAWGNAVVLPGVIKKVRASTRLLSVGHLGVEGHVGDAVYVSTWFSGEAYLGKGDPPPAKDYGGYFYWTGGWNPRYPIHASVPFRRLSGPLAAGTHDFHLVILPGGTSSSPSIAGNSDDRYAVAVWEVEVDDRTPAGGGGGWV